MPAEAAGISKINHINIKGLNRRIRNGNARAPLGNENHDRTC
jgi:hypothetical protein